MSASKKLKSQATVIKYLSSHIDKYIYFEVSVVNESNSPYAIDIRHENPSKKWVDSMYTKDKGKK